MKFCSLHSFLYELWHTAVSNLFFPFSFKAPITAAGQERTQGGEEEVLPSFNYESSTGGKKYENKNLENC